MSGGAAETADRVARGSYGKLIAYLSARTRDVAAAEDALADAFAAALKDWPVKGCPDNPEAWLLTAARRKLIDAARRRRSKDEAAPHLALLAEELTAAAAAADAPIPDHRLALMFACAHPAIEQAVHAPLILQTVLGLSAQTIASAFLTSPSAMGKRLVRAKTGIRTAQVAFRVPEREELRERLGSVLEAIYAAFTEGWNDPAGADAVRRELTGEALYLARLVARMLPEEPEALGLLALMLHAAARRGARRTPQGDFAPLAEQDTAQWDKAMIGDAERVLRRAGTLGVIGRFQLEAALQSAHVFRRLTGASNWADIVAIYDALLAVTGSPVVAVNRALARAEVEGAPTALAILDALSGDLGEYQPYWAGRAELLGRTGAKEEARKAYDMAIGLERDPAVRRFLQQRKAAL